MAENTSIQINIGVNEDTNWDIKKGVLKIDDDYVFEGVEKSRRYKYKNILENVNLNGDIDQQMIQNLKKYGAKSFNLNIERILENKYAEFRYIGGVVSLELVLEKMIYFCSIVDLMTGE